MKRNILYSLLAFLFVASIYSCKEITADQSVSQDEPVVINPSNVELNDQELGLYYGDRYRNSTGVYSLVLSDAVCYRDGYGDPYLDSQGDMLVIELNGELLDKESSIVIPTGRYILGDTKAGSLSINPESSYVVRLEGHTQSRYAIRSGAINVVRTPDGGYDIVSEDMIITKDGKEYPVNYSFYGDLRIEDFADVAPALVTVKDDIIDMPYTDIVGLYYGNLYGYGTANYVLTLYTKDFSESTVDKPGMLLTINLFDELISGDELPMLTPGKYKVKGTFDASEFSILYGLTASSSTGGSYAFGSYIYQIDAVGGEIIDYITSGSMDVKLEGQNDYTFEYEFKTQSGRMLKGMWIGPVEFSNLATDDDRVVLSTLEDDVECDMSKIEKGSLRHVETLKTTEMIPRDITEAWQLTLQPRDFTAEEKKLPWEERIEVYCPDGDAMTIEFMLPLGSDGNIAPQMGKEYVYTIQPDLSISDYDYQLVTSKMGRPYDDIYNPENADMYYFMKGYDFCNSRRGFTWDGGYRGIWYFHYLEKHWLNMDEHAPAVRGAVKVKRLTDIKTEGGRKVVTYSLEWNLIDDSDAANRITGSWTGPVTIY